MTIPRRGGRIYQGQSGGDSLWFVQRRGGAIWTGVGRRVQGARISRASVGGFSAESLALAVHFFRKKGSRPIRKRFDASGFLLGAGV